MNSGTGIYKSGVLAFFAGAILIGALLGAVTFCFMGSDELSMLSVFSNSFVDVRSSGDLEEILVRSFFSSTVFLAVVFLSGFSSLGQPLAVAVLLLRGTGWGVAMSQLYSIYGGHGALLSAMFVLLPAVITAAALMIAAREAVAMSNILLRIVFSEGQHSGLRQTVRLYAVKFLVLEAAAAVAAALECLLTIIFAVYSIQRMK